MKLFLWVILGIVVLGLAAWMITVPGPPRGPVLFLFVIIFAVPPVGAFWMLYQVIRYEKQPLPLILLAFFVPFVFLWYYFERVRPRKHQTRVSSLQE
jgi:hypothetical protein